jgi:hypothetical protein
VTSDKQTLILAGEPLPRRGVAMLEPQPSPRLPAPYAASSLPVTSTTRGSSSGAAQYARTRDLLDTGTLASFIDTYA